MRSDDLLQRLGVEADVIESGFSNWAEAVDAVKVDEQKIAFFFFFLFSVYVLDHLSGVDVDDFVAVMGVFLLNFGVLENNVNVRFLFAICF